MTKGEIAVASKEDLHAAPLSGKRLLALWNALPGGNLVIGGEGSVPLGHQRELIYSTDHRQCSMQGQRGSYLTASSSGESDANLIFGAPPGRIGISKPASRLPAWRSITPGTI